MWKGDARERRQDVRRQGEREVDGIAAVNMDAKRGVTKAYMPVRLGIWAMLLMEAFIFVRFRVVVIVQLVWHESSGQLICGDFLK